MLNFLKLLLLGAVFRLTNAESNHTAGSVFIAEDLTILPEAYESIWLTLPYTEALPFNESLLSSAHDDFRTGLAEQWRDYGGIICADGQLTERVLNLTQHYVEDVAKVARKIHSMLKQLKKTMATTVNQDQAFQVTVQALGTTSSRGNWDSFGPGAGTQRWTLSPHHFPGFLRRDKTYATAAEREPPVERTAQECHSGHRRETPSDCQFPELCTTPTQTDDIGVQWELSANPSSIQPAAGSHAHKDRERLLRQCETAHPLNGLVGPVPISFELLERILRYTGRTIHVLSITGQGSAPMAHGHQWANRGEIGQRPCNPGNIDESFGQHRLSPRKTCYPTKFLEPLLPAGASGSQLGREAGLFVRLTIPTAELDKFYQSYRAVSIPQPIPSTETTKTYELTNYILLTTDERRIFVERSMSDFVAQCPLSGRVQLCERPFLWNKLTKDDCLTNLYLGRDDAAVRTCHYTVMDLPKEVTAEYIEDSVNLVIAGSDNYSFRNYSAISVEPVVLPGYRSCLIRPPCNGHIESYGGKMESRVDWGSCGHGNGSIIHIWQPLC